MFTNNLKGGRKTPKAGPWRPKTGRRSVQLEPFEEADFSRARELMEDYDYLMGFGIANASNVVLAERYDTRDILTTDQRDFRRIKLPGGRHFRILPYDL